MSAVAKSSLPPIPMLHEKTLPIRIRTTVAPGEERVLPIVACPRGDEMVDARGCAGCMRMRALEWHPDSGGEVTCLLSGAAPAADLQADFVERAARARVRDVMAAVGICVRADLGLDAVRSLLVDRAQRALLVVDQGGKLQGIVSRTDVASAPREGTAADVMTARVHALPEDAPLSYAVALFAFEDLVEVPVVKDDGTVVGICYSRDVMTWVAARLGYTKVGRK